MKLFTKRAERSDRLAGNSLWEIDGWFGPLAATDFDVVHVPVSMATPDFGSVTGIFARAKLRDREAAIEIARRGEGLGIRGIVRIPYASIAAVRGMALLGRHTVVDCADGRSYKFFFLSPLTSWTFRRFVRAKVRAAASRL